MISRKSSKKKAKSKRSVKSRKSSITKHRNPAVGSIEPPINALGSLLLNRSRFNKAIHHNDGLWDNIEKDVNYGILTDEPSKADLLKYLRAKKENIEQVIADFIGIDVIGY